MARICPFLALESDGRTAIGAYDADHRCFALEAPEPLPRAQQLGLCLEPAHTACERYVAALGRHAPGRLWARPAPDADIVSTRLTLNEGLGRDPLADRGPASVVRRWAVAGALGLVGIVAVAGGVTGVLGSLDRGESGASTGPSGTTIRAAGGASASPSATASPTPRPSPTSDATPTPRPTRREAPRRTATPAPTPQTYVVQTGDTLNAIATRFGTSVAAIQQANGLGSSEVILVGQVLVIP